MCRQVVVKIVSRLAVGCVDLDFAPQQYRSGNRLDGDGPRIGYRHQLAALFAWFFAMASLNVSRKDDIWISAENLPIVHVPKRPVLVTLIPERVQRARCVVGMLRDAGQIR